MAFDKLIDALNDFRGEYAKELGLSLSGGSSAGSSGRGQGYNASGKLGESIKLPAQPKVKLFGKTYQIQITMLDYGITLDEGRNAGVDVPTIDAIKKWLTWPNVLARVGDQDKQWTDKKRTSWAEWIVYGKRKYRTPGKHWIQPALDKVTPRIAKVVEDAIAEDIEITFEEIKRIIEG
tara:strand:- start:539 stop:1072 length:534 start_codon:yes stop_codon:yes gene_type:complete